MIHKASWTLDIDPLANVTSPTLSGTAAVGSPTIRSGSGLYDCETILGADEDISDLDEGSIEDGEMNTWADGCDSAFGIGFNTFPSDTDDPQPMFAFSDGLFSDEVLADTPISVHEELPRLAVRVFTYVRVPVIPPVVGLTFNGLWTGWSVRTNGWTRSPICDPPIHIGTGDMNLSHGDTEWVCLLYSAGAGSVNNGTVAMGLDGQRLDHWRGAVWDPGIGST